LQLATRPEGMCMHTDAGICGPAKSVRGPPCTAGTRIQSVTWQARMRSSVVCTVVFGSSSHFAVWFLLSVFDSPRHALGSLDFSWEFCLQQHILRGRFGVSDTSFKNHTLQRRHLQQARTLTPMNTRTQILPLGAPPNDWASHGHNPSRVGGARPEAGPRRATVPAGEPVP
jgi:hypothetical protein